MNFVQRRKYLVTHSAGIAITVAMLATLLISAIVALPARARPRPNDPSAIGGATATSAQGPHTPAQQRYAAWLAQQQAKYETPQTRAAALAKATKLPAWKPDAHEVTSRARPLPQGAIAPHSAVPVTTDPNNWTALGPAPVTQFSTTFSGSVSDVATSASNPNDVWIATSSGGAWHSTDGGATWTATTDSQPTLLFGAIAVDPTNDSVVYVGGGDPNSFQGTGDGIFKTTDNGATWTLEQPYSPGGTLVYRIVIDSSNDQTILAAVGMAGGSVPSVSGLWRSTDGGTTWTEVLDDAANTSFSAAEATDVVFDAANPAIVYAAMANTSESLSTTSIQGIYKSTDHGATWTLLTGVNAPTGQNVGRVSLGLSQDGAHLYAAIADSGFSNSANGGALLNSSIYEYTAGTNSWAAISLASSVLSTNFELQYGWNLNNVIAVAPTDATGATVYLGHDGLYRSADSGATWTRQGASSNLSYTQTSLVFPSASSPAFYLTGSGGIWHFASGVFTNDNTTLDIGSVSGGDYGDTGSDSPLYAQMYQPIYGAIQYPPGFTGEAGWTYVNFGGQNGDTVDWSNNANVYATSLTCANPPTCTTTVTTVEKSANGGGTFNPTSLSTTDALGYSVSPTISPTHPQTLFLGTTRLWATTNGGTTWNTISPQLDTTPQFGTTCTGPSDTGCPFITQVAVAPTSDNVIVVAYTDGQAFATNNGGASWYGLGLCVVSAGCTSGNAYLLYAVSPANPLVMYAAGFYNGSPGATGVFTSTNGGHSWTLLPASASLPGFANSLAISPANPHLIVMATYLGAFVSTDDGQDWARVTGLPNAGVSSAFFSHDGSQLIVTTEGRGVWGIAMPHLTLAQQAITLTTLAGSSPASQTVTLGNTGQGTLSWSTSGLPSWLSVAPSSGSIAPDSSQQVTLSFDTPSLTPQTYSTMLAFSGNADNSNITLPVTVSSSLSKTWYFAEGYTGTGFTEYLTLANPTPGPANVTVEYLLQNGNPPITKSYTVAAVSRRTLNVNSELGGLGVGVSLVVSSDVPIVAERPMYFTFSGSGLSNIPGGSDVLGATSLGTQFDFGYLDTSANHVTYLTVLNPNSTPMTVTADYFASAGGAPTMVQHTVPANARGTILVNADVPSAGSYSALVTLSAAGLVERPMYLRDALTGQTGSTDVIGVQQLATSWSFAEGYTSSSFSERYILSNPTSGSGAPTAHATVTFLRADGTTASASVTLTPGQQQVVDANSVLGSGGVNNSATVTADAPILAERFMSFAYSGPVGVSGSATIPGATDVLGTSQVGSVYLFAEGYTGDGFAEYLTLQNPQATTTQVTVVYLPQNGSAPTIATYFVGAHSRYTILTNRVMVGQSFSMVVVASAPVVAERPMYFNYNDSGQTGGTDVIGYQP